MRTLVQVEKIWHTWEVNYSIAGLWHSVQSLIFAMNSRFMTTPLLWAMVCWKLHSGKLHKLVKNRKSQGKKKKNYPSLENSSLVQNSKIVWKTPKTPDGFYVCEWLSANTFCVTLLHSGQWTVQLPSHQSTGEPKWGHMVRSRRQGGENKVTILQSSWGKSMAEFQPHELHFPNLVHAASRRRKRWHSQKTRGGSSNHNSPLPPSPHHFLGIQEDTFSFFFSW